MSIVRHPYLLNKELSENEEQHEVDTTIHSNRNIFSVVKFSGTQFKVTLVSFVPFPIAFNRIIAFYCKDDVIVADKIEGIDIGDDIHVDEVIHFFLQNSCFQNNCFLPGIAGRFLVCDPCRAPFCRRGESKFNPWDQFIKSNSYNKCFADQVTFSVEEITKDKKVIAFKMRRRKNSKRTKGFRRDVTILRVKDITLNDSSLKDELLR